MIITPKITDENNLKEVRGWIIDCLNGIEMFVDKLIIDFFKPSNVEEFKKIILNSSIINFGAKIKILSNMEYIPNSIIDKIRKLSSIRNGFAHAHSKNVIKTTYDASNEKSLNVKFFQGIEVMNSNGKVEIKNFADYFTDFKVLFEESKSELTKLFNSRSLNIL